MTINRNTIVVLLIAVLLCPVGMEAKKKVKKEEVPQLANHPSAELNEYRLHGGEVVIPGPEIGNMIVNEELTAKEFRDNPSIVLPLMDDFFKQRKAK
jgi:adenosyl cobinamide kinase/adenosyl cobinamide phosphate guanylyltransferase